MKTINLYLFLNLIVATFFCGSNNLIAQELKTFSANGKFGLENSKGDVIVPPIYNGIGEFSEGLAVVTLGEGLEKKSGYINTKGKVVVEIKYEDAKIFSEGLAAVALIGPENEPLYGFINKTGEIVIPCKYINANNFKNGLALVVVFQGVYNIDKLDNIVH